jgi:hypothetical protein
MSKPNARAGNAQISVAFPLEVGATEETEIVGLLDRLWKAIGGRAKLSTRLGAARLNRDDACYSYSLCPFSGLFP